MAGAEDAASVLEQFVQEGEFSLLMVHQVM